VADEHVYSGDESGALPLKGRPIIQQMLAAARRGEFDAVCFTKIDRMARKLRYMLELWDALDTAGITVHVIQESIDTSTHVGRLIRGVLGSIAEFERDTILDRTMGGQKRKAERGEAYSSRQRYGYRYHRANKDEGLTARYVIDPATAPLVQRMFESVASGVSCERLSIEFTAEGIPTLRGRKNWCVSTIRQIIRNPQYKGLRQWGRFVGIPSDDGRRRVRFVKDEQELITMAVPAIVSEELWTRANAEVDRKKYHRRSKPKHEYLFTKGIVQCAREHPVGPERTRAMSGHTDHHWTGYGCMYAAPDGKRRSHYIGAAVL
jgi:site-specific DNA recombinase